MKNYFYSAAALISACVFNSCSTQMYVSNAVNAPLLKEKGEVQVAVTQNDLQAAVGLGSNFGIMANGFYRNYQSDNQYKHNGLLGELGIGYFKPLQNNFVFETYVGGGAGRVYKQQEFTAANDERYLAKFDASAVKGFIQPNFGYKSRFFDAVISSRFSALKYSSFSQSNYPAAELQKDYLDNNNLTGPVFMFAEPALTLRGGFKYVKLQAQFGLTINVTGSNIRHDDNFSSLGIIINIAKWYDGDGETVTPVGN
jgi:hypothetical protein